MPLRLSDVFRPLNLAAYLAWAAIGWELLGLRVEPTAWWSAPPPAALLAVLHAGFLGLFIWNTAGEPGSRLSRGLLLGQVGSSRVDLQACKLEYSIVSPK